MQQWHVVHAITSFDCRPQRKQLHATLHSLALVCIVGAIAAAISSHTLKRPDPIPNFYSPHSWLGLTTLSVVAAQVTKTALSFALL